MQWPLLMVSAYDAYYNLENYWIVNLPMYSISQYSSIPLLVDSKLHTLGMCFESFNLIGCRLNRTVE